MEIKMSRGVLALVLVINCVTFSESISGKLSEIVLRSKRGDYISEKKRDLSSSSTSFASSTLTSSTLTSSTTLKRDASSSPSPSPSPSSESSSLSSNTIVETGSTTLSTTSTTMTASTSTSMYNFAVNDTCLAENKIEDLCDVPPVLSGLDIWDVYMEMFSDDVIRSLLVNCASGHWCLKDRFGLYAGMILKKAEMVLVSPVVTAACEPSIKTCLRNMIDGLTDCITYQRLNFTLQTLDFLCSLTRQEGVVMDVRCLSHVLIALHVTVVDILRDQNRKSEQQDLVNGFTDETCKTPEAQMTKTYLCIETKCKSTIGILSRFSPWEWFMNDIDAISNECNFERGVCDDDTKFDNVNAASPSAGGTTTTSPGWEFFGEPSVIGSNGRLEGGEEEVEEEEIENEEMLIGVFTISVIILFVMAIAFSIWWKKHRRVKMVKNGYAPLLCDDQD